jgi:hypothetical protein
VAVLAVLAVLVGGADRAIAGPLNPVDFPLSGSGAFPTAAGMFAFDTSNLTLSGPGITTPIQGSLSTTGVAVFDFNAVTVGGDQTFVGMGSAPLALLSRNDINVNGTIDVSGFPGLTNVFYSALGGPGGFGSGGGPGAGADGSTTVTGTYYNAPGGGGFGGRGGNGGSLIASQNGPVIDPFGGGSGGGSYGNLAISLQEGAAEEANIAGPHPLAVAAEVRLRSALSVGSQSAAASWQTAAPATAPAVVVAVVSSCMAIPWRSWVS